MFCFKIIICLVLRLLLVSSDFSKLGGHLKRLIQSCIRPGVAWPIPSDTAGELLPHLCTITCEINPSVVFWEQFVILNNTYPFSVVRSASSRCPEFLRRSVLGCTDFPHKIVIYPVRLSGCFLSSIILKINNTNEFILE